MERALGATAIFSFSTSSNTGISVKPNLWSLRFQLIQALNEAFRDVVLGIPVHISKSQLKEPTVWAVWRIISPLQELPWDVSELLACSALVFIILI